MSERSPSPALVRFLLTHWALTPTTLADVRSQSESFSVEEWADFNPSVVKQDLDTAIERLGVGASVRDLAKPVVICLFEDGQQGKTTVAHLLQSHGIPVFSTDAFVANLRESWHNEESLRELAKQTVPHCINEFIKHVENSDSLAKHFVDLFFDARHGFNLRTPVSIIEGYLHNLSVPDPKVQLHKAIAKRLRERGYRVWITSRYRDGS